MENNYQLSRIHNYVMGLMDAQEMNRIEREALEDPFLQDAIDGYRLQKGVNTQHLSALQQRLQQRLQVQAQSKHQQYFAWQRLAIGTAAGVIFIAISALFLFRYLPTTSSQRPSAQQHAAAARPFEVEVNTVFDGTPQGGWETFYQHLQQQQGMLSSLPAAQQGVRISFDIDANGRPQHIETSLQTIAPREDASLKESILSGPLWKGRAVEITLLMNP